MKHKISKFEVFSLSRFDDYLNVINTTYFLKIQRSFLGISYWSTVRRFSTLEYISLGDWGSEESVGNPPLIFSNLGDVDSYIDRYNNPNSHIKIRKINNQ